MLISDVGPGEWGDGDAGDVWEEVQNSGGRCEYVEGFSVTCLFQMLDLENEVTEMRVMCERKSRTVEADVEEKTKLKEEVL